MNNMDMKCSKCDRVYRDLFDTVVSCDYADPGKGKPYIWHLCLDCRKKLLCFLENK